LKLLGLRFREAALRADEAADRAIDFELQVEEAARRAEDFRRRSRNRPRDPDNMEPRDAESRSYKLLGNECCLS